jgi:hypothetical protein
MATVTNLLALALVILAGSLLAAAYRFGRPQPMPVRPNRRPATSGGVRQRPVRQIRTEVPHLLYCYKRPDGRRIYGGISNEPPERHARHLIDPDDRWWMVQTDGVMYPVRWLPNRDTARAAERALVREMYHRGEDPANDHHNPGRRRVVRR